MHDKDHHTRKCRKVRFQAALLCSLLVLAGIVSAGTVKVSVALFTSSDGLKSQACARDIEDEAVQHRVELHLQLKRAILTRASCRRTVTNMVASRLCSFAAASPGSRAACALQQVRAGSSNPSQNIAIRPAAVHDRRFCAFSTGLPARQVRAAGAGSSAGAASGGNGGDTVNTLKAHIRNSAIAFVIGGAAPVIASMAVRTAIPIALAALGVAVFVTGGYVAPLAMGGTIALLHKTGNAVSSLPVVCGCGAVFVAGYLFRIVTKAVQRRS